MFQDTEDDSHLLKFFLLLHTVRQHFYLTHFCQLRQTENLSIPYSVPVPDGKAPVLVSCTCPVYSFSISKTDLNATSRQVHCQSLPPPVAMTVSYVPARHSAKPWDHFLIFHIAWWALSTVPLLEKETQNFPKLSIQQELRKVAGRTRPWDICTPSTSPSCNHRGAPAPGPAHPQHSGISY